MKICHLFNILCEEYHLSKIWVYFSKTYKLFPYVFLLNFMISDSTSLRPLLVNCHIIAQVLINLLPLQNKYKIPINSFGKNNKALLH